jgi:hypothetical protein
MKRIPRKLKKKLKKQNPVLLSLLMIDDEVMSAYGRMKINQLTGNSSKNYPLTEWHKTHDIMSDNIRPMTEDQKWSGRIW